MLLIYQGMSELDDGWSLHMEPSPAPCEPQPTIADVRRRCLSKLLREAMLILDGEAPDEVPLQGDGWSLVGPATPKSARPEEAAAQLALSEEALSEEAATDSAPSSNVVAFPTPERSKRDALHTAMHEALEDAIAEGWNLAVDEDPTDTLELSNEEQAFFDAGDELATLPIAATTTRSEPEYEQRDGFWVRFWRKTA